MRQFPRRGLAKSLLAGALGGLLLGAGTAHAFSFDFGNDDYDYPPPWAVPYWGAPPAGYVPANPYLVRPLLPRGLRDELAAERKRFMEGHQEALNDLAAMLYGGKGFDRTEAIKLARKIEGGSGINLMRFFPPGSAPAWGSRALPSIWTRQEDFQAKADALGQAAAALAEELAKVPDPKQAIYLPKPNAPFECRDRDDPQCKVPVSPGVWEKFNKLSATCQGCHLGFRGYGWW
ncbi:MAG: cytochrome c [Gammaproteobacteria bacterium]|nr:MAG: cytochrome c [Gammaproteobacteria bacterium]